MGQRFDELRALPPATIAAVIVTHVLLLALVLRASLPYVYTQAMLAVELVVFNMATAAVHRERLGEFLVSTVKLIGGLAFVLVFVVVTYGVAREGGNGQALATGLEGLRLVATTSAAWAGFFIVAHAAIALWQVTRSPDPRKAWADNAMAESGATFVAMVMMVFVAALLGPMLGGSRESLDIDALLGSLMVALRAFFSLVVAAIQKRRGAQDMAAASVGAR